MVFNVAPTLTLCYNTNFNSSAKYLATPSSSRLVISLLNANGDILKLSENSNVHFNIKRDYKLIKFFTKDKTPFFKFLSL